MACTTFVDGHGRCMMFGVLELMPCSAGWFSQPAQCFSLTQNQPSRQPSSSIFLSRQISPANSHQPAEPGVSGLCVFGIETETYACGCICLTACLICSEVMSCLCLLVAVTRRGLRSPDV